MYGWGCGTIPHSSFKCPRAKRGEGDQGEGPGLEQAEGAKGVLTLGTPAVLHVYMAHKTLFIHHDYVHTTQKPAQAQNNVSNVKADLYGRGVTEFAFLFLFAWANRKFGSSDS